MALTTEQIRLYLDIKSEYVDGRLEVDILMAKRRIVEDEVATSHADYDLILYNAVGMILVTGNAGGDLSPIDSGVAENVTEEKVGDVFQRLGAVGQPAKYNGVLKDLAGGGYESAYLKMIRDINGIGHLIS